MKKEYVVVMYESREYKYITLANNKDEAVENVENGKHQGEEELDTDCCWGLVNVKEKGNEL